MTKDQAKLLVPGDTIFVQGNDDPYVFLRLDEDGDILVSNRSGSPTPMAFHAFDCEVYRA